MQNFVIQGAVYFNGDCLLIPHFSGNYYIVDCTQYLPLSTIKEDYDDNFYNNIVENGFYLEYNGTQYYECECNPYHTNDFTLLSDLSNLIFTETETNF